MCSTPCSGTVADMALGIVRLISLLVVCFIGVGGLWIIAGKGSLTLGQPPDAQTYIAFPADHIVNVRNASPSQHSRLAAALERFALAELELPDLEVVFSDDTAACRDHLGLFLSRTTPWRILICSRVDFLYEHELAHAWEKANLSEETRQKFMELRGYRNWSDYSAAWNERGVEGAAFVIQQGLAGLPLPPVLGREAVNRLVAFELLTGRPAPRLVEWMTTSEIPCDERPTELSEGLPDASHRICSFPLHPGM